MEEPSGNALLSVAGVASTLQVSRQRVHQLIQTGRLQAQQWDGLHWVVLASDLEAYIGSDELEASQTVRSEWQELRRAILAQGGIGPSPDWSRDWYCGLYRRQGKAPDLVAAETYLGVSRVQPWASPDDGNQTPSDTAMFAYLRAAYERR